VLNTDRQKEIDLIKETSDILKWKSTLNVSGCENYSLNQNGNQQSKLLARFVFKMSGFTVTHVHVSTAQDEHDQFLFDAAVRQWCISYMYIYTLYWRSSPFRTLRLSGL